MKLAEAPVQTLGDAVEAAAVNAFDNIKVKVSRNDSLFTEIRQFGNNKKKPGETLEQDLKTPAQAKAFVAAFTAELKKRNVFDEYQRTMTLAANGNTLVFTQKAAKAQPVAGETTEVAALHQVIDKTCGTQTPLQSEDLEPFLEAYKVYDMDKKRGDLNNGATMTLAVGTKKKAEEFVSAFQANLAKSGVRLDVTAKVRQDAPNRYVVDLTIPEITRTTVTDAEASARL